MSFWGELKRRNVFKVGAAYVIVAWLIVQVANTFFPILHLPEWAVTLVAALLILGLPVALILAWAYEMTPEGVKLTKKVPLADSITQVTGRKLNYVLGGLLVIAVALLIFDNYYLDRRVSEPEEVPSVAEPEPIPGDVKESPKTIAVLPFDDLSPEKDQEYFVLGLSEEILNSLAQIADLTVIAKTSSFSFKDKDKTIQEIAGILGVENILEGSVRKAGNALRITAQLIKAVDGSHLWSKTYDKEFKVEEMFSVQEDIAKVVANELKVTLGVGESFRRSISTTNIEAYELYLVAKGLCGSVGEGGIYEISKQALESVDASIALDPGFAPAWAVKATLHVWLNAFGPAGRSSIERDAAMGAAQKAIELEPNLAAGYIPMGWAEESNADRIAAEGAFRKALELETESSASDGMIYISLHYISVGNFKKTDELLKEHRRNNPLDIASRGNYMINFVLLGDPQRAEEEFNRCWELFGDRWDVGNQYILPICRGIKDTVSRGDIVYPNRIFDAAKTHLDSPEDAIKNLREIFNSDENVSTAEYLYIALWAAWFGDSIFAMDAIEKGLRIDASGTFWIWMPVFHEARQLPRFKELVREIGLVDYWEQFGWPDLCHPTDDGDFECD